MPSLNELRNDLLDEQVPLSAVLRRAYVLARSLDEPLFLGWIESELNGYTFPEDPRSVGEVPDYRRPPRHADGRRPFRHAQAPAAAHRRGDGENHAPHLGRTRCT